MYVLQPPFPDLLLSVFVAGLGVFMFILQQ